MSAAVHSPLDAVVAVVFLISMVVWFRQFRFEQWMFTLICFAVPLMSVADADIPRSLVRYVIVLFPMFLVFSRKMESSYFFATYIAFSTVGLIVLTGAFANWYWVA